MMAITPTPDSEALPLDGRLWTFATGAYARAGVAEACIALQDEFDIDVALLLFTAWAGAEAGLTLSPDHLAAAAAGVSDWRDEIVAVLRSVRRRLRSGPAPAPDAATEALRDEVKWAELSAERIELAWLEQLATPWLEAGRPDEAIEAVARNLDACFTAATGRAPSVRAAELLKSVARGCPGAAP